MRLKKNERTLLAKQTLQGLTVGDCFGETFFAGFAGFLNSSLSMEEIVDKRELAITDWFWTDDSNMAFSIYKILNDFGEIDQYALAQSFADRYDVGRGYGSGMHNLLNQLRQGANWEFAAQNLFNGQGSFGNGSAMRVAPIGAYFADNLDIASEQAKKSAVVTHAHPEAVDGAIAIAVATSLAWKFKQENKRPSHSEFINPILPFLSDTKLREKTILARDLDLNISTKEVADILGNGSEISCPDTVPFCLFMAGKYLDNYEEALWQTVSALGDRDTTCAIVGGIVSTYTGIEQIPIKWKEKSEEIPSWVFK